MATKLTVSIIFVLFTLCYAESQLEFPERDVVLNDDVTDLPQSDSEVPNIFLPSQKAESEINKPVDSKPDEVETVPLTVVTFRPINRRFRQGPFLPFRHGRRCGGFGRRGMVKPWLMRFKGGEIPYGKDMIVDKVDSEAEHGGVQDMPAKIERFGRGGERFEFGSDMAIVPLHRHHHRFHVEDMIVDKVDSEAEHGGVQDMPAKIERFGRGGERFEFGSDMAIVPLHRHHHRHHRHHPYRFHVEEEEEKRENEHEHRDEDEEEEGHHHHHPHGGHRDEDEEEEEHHHHHPHGGLFWKIRKFLHHF